jgi:alpha-L-fucosidase
MRGLMHENDLKSLLGFKQILDDAFKNNLAYKQKITTDASGKGYHGEKMIDGDPESYWAAPEERSKYEIIIQLEEVHELNAILLQEYIGLGQRIKSFSVEVKIADEFVVAAEATSIGYKRILTFDTVKTDEIRVTILDSRAAPVLSEIQLYRFPDF